MKILRPADGSTHARSAARFLAEHLAWLTGSRAHAALAIASALALAACSDMLPKAQDEVASPWHSFEEARDTIERLVPGQTSTAELREARIDPYANPNVQLLSYSDILLRFPVNAAAYDRLDAGLRRCLDAGKTCVGYAIAVKETHHDRTGSFLLDTFGFKRVTDTSGWTFNALILLVDDQVVYTLYGGQPSLREREVARQPLGPVQGIGDAAASMIK